MMSCRSLRELIVLSKQPKQLAYLKMKSYIVLALCVVASLAAPLDDSKQAIITKLLSENNGLDGYKFAVQTSDGKTVEEEGRLNYIGTENEALEVRGQFSYTGPDNRVYTVYYIANEKGFQPQGEHIPAGPQ